MKNYLLLIFVLSGVLLLNGCKDNEEPLPDSIYLFATEGSADKAGGVRSITVYATCSWTSSADSWITVEPASGPQGIHAVHLKYEAGDGAARSGKVVFTAGTYTETYTLHQPE